MEKLTFENASRLTKEANGKYIILFHESLNGYAGTYDEVVSAIIKKNKVHGTKYTREGFFKFKRWVYSNDEIFIHNGERYPKEIFREIF